MSLPTKCRVCSYEGVTAGNLTINKPLRLTIRQWLQKRERIRDQARTEVPTSTSGTSDTTAVADATTSSKGKQGTAQSDNTKAKSQEPGQNTGSQSGDVASDATNTRVRILGLITDDDLKADAVKQDIVIGNARDQSAKEERQKSATPLAGATTASHGESPRQEALNQSETTDSSDVPRENDISDPNNVGMNWNNTNGPMFGNGFGYDSTEAAFPGMDWSNNGMFNPMLQMQMQPSFGGFPNMGTQFSTSPKPSRRSNTSIGMGMNAMGFSPGMFGGYGMQGMNPIMAGMNGMNMNMNSSGGYNSWNGHQMGDDFGANAGYYPNGGYNLHHQHPNGNFHNQNRFHGQGPVRPGFGRGSQGTYRRGGSQVYNSRPDSRNSSFIGMKQDTPVAGNVQDGSPNELTDQTEAEHISNQPSELPEQRHQDDTTKRDANDETHQNDAALDDQFGPAGGIDESILPDFANGTRENNTRDTDRTPTHQINPAEPVSAPPSSTAESATSDIRIITEDPQDAMMESRIEGLQTGCSTPSQYLFSDMGSVFGIDTPTSDQHDYTGQLWANDFPRGRGGSGYHRDVYQRGGFRGRGGRKYNNWTRVFRQSNHRTDLGFEPAGQGVEGAPKGPKAWRDGTVGQSRGGSLTARRSASIAMSEQPNQPERPESQTQSSERARSPEAAIEQPKHADRSAPGLLESHGRAEEPADITSTSRQDQDDDTTATNDEFQSRLTSNGDRMLDTDSQNRRSSKRDRDEYGSSRSRHRREEKERERSVSESSDYTGRRRDSELKVSRSTRAKSLPAALQCSNIWQDRRESEPSRRRHHDRHRERDRERDRDDKARHRDREDRGRERGGDDRDREQDRKDRARGRDHDKERKRRRDRSAESSDYHRSSRRSRKERDKDRSRERRRSRSPSREREREHERRSRNNRTNRKHDIDDVRSSSKKTSSNDATPTAQEEEFKIAGRSSRKPSTTETSRPASSRSNAHSTQLPAPSSMAPPTGPRLDRDRSGQIPRGPSRSSSASQPSQSLSASTPSTATTAPAPSATATATAGNVDIYAMERERARQERLAVEERRRSMTGAAQGRKRSYGSTADDEALFGAPTGPKADGGGRKRRVLDDRAERLRQVEMERERARWD